MANNNLRVTELDFDLLKENLKTFLRAQSQFTDYDFDGANLSVLLDLLAYNTHYNAVLANMMSNEMFLDTAIKRSSVVSLAKHLNYTPRSVRSARATVDITLSNITGNPTYINIDRYTGFNTTIDGETYTFYNIQSYATTPSYTSGNAVYNFTNVELYQGRKLDYYFSVTVSGSSVPKYVIPNQNVDTTTLQVSVQNGGVGASETYDLVNDITEITSDSKVYYLQENVEGFYEIYFGDDVLGKSLSAGDIVKVTYLISDGADANVSTTLNVTWTTNSIAGETSYDRAITTVSKPSGGSAADTADQVRFHSINAYSAQNRAVTKNDHASLISYYVPGAESVNVWGGENNDPPKYGKTFISIKPKTGYVLTDAERSRIINEVLMPRAVVTTDPVFVDPEYTYITITADVIFSSAKTNRTSNQIQSLTNTAIETFFATNLEQFNATFYKSQLESAILQIDSAILSVNITFSLQKRINVEPYVRFTKQNVFQFPSKIHPARLESCYFYFVLVSADGKHHLTRLKDIPNESPPNYEGTGLIVAEDLETGQITDDNVGTIYYSTGKIVLDSTSYLTVDGYVEGQTQFIIQAGVQEDTGYVTPAFNEILVLDDSIENVKANINNGVTVNVTAVNS